MTDKLLAVLVITLAVALTLVAGGFAAMLHSFGQSLEAIGVLGFAAVILCGAVGLMAVPHLRIAPSTVGGEA